MTEPSPRRTRQLTADAEGLQYPHDPRPRDGAPDVLVIVLDDLGFAQIGAFGSDIATPNMDRLAAGGLRYNRFHVTALCSPTRASLLTGRNHHAVGVGFLVDIPIAYQGYNARVPKSAATLPRILKDSGYSTMAVGKWHLTPRWERSPSGPFDRWPLGFGFERFYGFLQGDANHWAPELVCDNHYVEQPRTPEDGYHLSEDLVDTATRMILDQKQATPDKPYFMYLAFGAMHSPHHVAPEWVEPYRGRFDQGWERWREETFARQVAAGIVPEGTVLPERPPWIQEWDALDPDDRRMFARMQEVYAGFLTHTDAQIGRLLDFLERTGRLDNTLVLLMSDNGASAEGGQLGTVNEHRFSSRMGDSTARNLAEAETWGGPDTYPHYAWGWAWAGNTPLRLWKRYTWLGGTRAPLIAHWPDGIAARGEIRGQIAHAADLMPTILDVCGVDAPDVVDGVPQQEIAGRSLTATFADPDAPAPRTTQYFEMLGSRSVIRGEWKATTDHVSRGVLDEERLLLGSRDFATDRWSLFHLADDFAEAHDLADQHPDLVEELEDLWFDEAERNHVLPLDDTMQERLAALIFPTYGVPKRGRYLPGGGPVRDETLPPLFAGFTLTADIEVPDDAAHGVLAALGDLTGGFVLRVAEGRLAFTCSRAGETDRVIADRPLAPGRRTVGVRYRPGDGSPDAAGTFVLLDDGAEIASAPVGGPWPTAFQHGGAGLSIGHDRGLPVDRAYRPPHAWNGVLHEVAVDTGTTPEPDLATELRTALHSD
ncbi:sulfatase-like hydrolase/transferase [Yinghuangia sp. ASG 101]|uniref:arylsulfatase n=1 Tax=Yinghuangia sp. ASG 101 TaxID=2896848 RepID=UPI001E4E0395|nr:arylsulfatase [Yinghuangia sp. ASG 101]UGQ12712.1 sulfatase-like hydrolase/transferase [Yinghuangia sp. ASG 101]